MTTHSGRAPKNNKHLQTSLSIAEARFLMIEHLTGRFESQADALRYYARRGLEAEGVLEEALECA